MFNNVKKEKTLPLFLELESQAGQDYLHDMEFCLEYSRVNRYEMLMRALNVISDSLNVLFLLN